MSARTGRQLRLLDEPTPGLDYGTVEAAVVRQLAELPAPERGKLYARARLERLRIEEYEAAIRRLLRRRYRRAA